MLVRTDVSVVSAIAGRGGRSMRNRFTNSPAMCWASAALPPFPKSRTLLPFLQGFRDDIDDPDDLFQVIPQEGLFELDAFTEDPFDDVVDFLHPGLLQ